MELVLVPLAQMRELLNCVNELQKEALVNMKIPQKTKNLIEKTVLTKHNLVYSINDIQELKKKWKEL